LEANEKQRRSSLSRSSDSADSDFDIFSDTGDLAEQLAEEEDPLRIKLRESLDREVFGGSSRRRSSKHKKVRYDSSLEDEEKEASRGVVKEDIRIPNPKPRHISNFEHRLAAIMNGGERQMHGLTGRSLVLVFCPEILKAC
jgi:hypothetical protein